MSSLRSNKSLLAPTALKVFDKHMLIGDKYVKHFLVLQAPQYYGLGLLSYYVTNPAIQLHIVEKKYIGNFLRSIRNEHAKKSKEYNKTADQTMKERLSKELDSLDGVIQDIIHNNDQVLDVIMIFSILSDTMNELSSLAEDFKSTVSAEGMKVSELALIQEELLRVSTPLFIDSYLDPTIESNLGIPLTTTNFAGMWAYNFQTLKHSKGFIFGREKNNHGMVRWDPFYWKRKADNTDLDITAGNIVILGKTGFGKSTIIGLVVRQLIRDKVSIVWVCPENKNQYLTKKYGGTFIQWGTKNQMINMFDLKPVSVEDDEVVNPYDTELAIYEVVDEFKNILKLYSPELDAAAFNIIDELIIKMYQTKNISFETSFKHLTATDYPILSDFNNEINKYRDEIKDKVEHHDDFELLKKIENAIRPMLSSHRYYFDGHTTVNIAENGRKIISFGTKSLKNKPQGLKNAMNYIMFRYAWSMCLDSDALSASIYDEGHEYILEGLSAPELAQQSRRSRKYNNIFIYASQEPRDHQSDVLVNGVAASVHGRAIINNATYKIIQYLEKDARNSLKDLVDLNDNELEAISEFVRGDALFLAGSQKLVMEVMATEKERSAIDPNAV